MHITKISMIQRLNFVARRRFRGVWADSISVALGFGDFVAVNTIALTNAIANVSWQTHLSNKYNMLINFPQI